MKQGIYLRAMAAEATEAVIEIIGVIGWEVAYDNLRNMLLSLPETVKQVTFDIYSPGGDVWEGNGIIQQIGELSQRGVKTVANIQVAASMATLIAVACDERVMAANGRWLIHNAWTMTIGDASEHEKSAESLRASETEFAQFYALRTGAKAEDIAALMNEERWMMAEEAKELGFIHEVADPFKAEDFAEVKEEIVAAGKWPQALVDIPAAEDVVPEPEPVTKPVVEDKSNADSTDDGAEPVAAVEQEVVETPADDETVVALREEYERGETAGIATGRHEALTAFGEKVDAMKAELEEHKNHASKLQSERDTLAAQLAAALEDGDKRVTEVQAELKVVTDKLQHHIAGSMTFSPTPRTWQEALDQCGGYVNAKQQHPELLTQFQKEENERSTRRG